MRFNAVYPRLYFWLGSALVALMDAPPLSCDVEGRQKYRMYSQGRSQGLGKILAKPLYIHFGVMQTKSSIRPFTFALRFVNVPLSEYLTGLSLNPTRLRISFCATEMPTTPSPIYLRMEFTHRQWHRHEGASGATCPPPPPPIGHPVRSMQIRGDFRVRKNGGRFTGFAPKF